MESGLTPTALHGAVHLLRLTPSPPNSPHANHPLNESMKCAIDARQADRESATDNAISALGNLLEAQRNTLSNAGTGFGGEEGVGRAWELWLGYMPLRADEEEAEKVGVHHEKSAVEGGGGVRWRGLRRLTFFVGCFSCVLGEKGSRSGDVGAGGRGEVGGSTGGKSGAAG